MANNTERLGTAAALALATSIAGSPALAETDTTEINTIPNLPPPIEQMFPECNPFYNLDIALATNPINPDEFKTDVDQAKSGKISYEELPYGIYRYITENPTDAGERFDIDSQMLDDLPTTAELMTEMLGDQYCPAPEIEIFTNESIEPAYAEIPEEATK